MRFTHRYKWLLVFGLVIRLVGVGIMIHSRGARGRYVCAPHLVHLCFVKLRADVDNKPALPNWSSLKSFKASEEASPVLPRESELRLPYLTETSPSSPRWFCSSRKSVVLWVTLSLEQFGRTSSLHPSPVNRNGRAHVFSST